MTSRKPGKNAFAFIFITVTLNMIGFGIIMPVMPKLIQAVTSEGLAEAARWGGKLSFAYAVMQFLLAPVMGALSDAYGRRPVILGSLAAYSVDFLLMGLAPSIALLLLARILAGAFSATISTANAFIADITPPEKRAANFGLIGAAFGLGFVIGPGIGGIIGQHFGPRAPFIAVAIIGALNFTYGYFFLPETLAPENRRPFRLKRANAFASFREFKKFPIILPIAAAVLLYELGHWVYPSTWSYFGEARFGWTPDFIGYSLMAVGLASAIVQGGLTRVIIPKLGERRSAITGLTIAAISYLAFGFATDAKLVYLIIIFSALAGLTVPSLQGIMSRTIPANAQGALQGAIASLNGVAMIFGPVIMTETFAAFSSDTSAVYFPGAAFILAAGLTALSLIPLLIAMGRVDRPRDTTPDTN